MDVQTLRGKLIEQGAGADLTDADLEEIIREEVERDAIVKILQDSTVALSQFAQRPTQLTIKQDGEVEREAIRELGATTEAVTRSLDANSAALAQLAQKPSEIQAALSAMKPPVIHAPPPELGPLVRAVLDLAAADRPAPQVKIDTAELGKQIVALSNALRQPPVVKVPQGPAPVIHVHLPKVKRVVQTVSRNKDGDMTSTESVYEYEE